MAVLALSFAQRQHSHVIKEMIVLQPALSPIFARCVQRARLLMLLALLLTHLAPALPTAEAAQPAQQPALAATKRAVLAVDANNNGKADPGDTLRYTVDISNTGSSDQAGLVFSDTLDPNTSLVAGSVRVSPIARLESYVALAGQALDVAAPGLLANDAGTPAPAVSPFNGPTARGGTVALRADGSFNYTPPPGFSSPPADSFSYVSSNSLGSDTTTVSLTVEAAPRVVAASLADGASGVNVGATIAITFSEAVKVTPNTFSLECPAGTTIPLGVSPGPATSFTLTPQQALPSTSNCRLTVAAAAVSDVDSNDPPDAMAADYVLAFSTADAAPQVIASLPADGQTSVALTSTIVISFSEPVNLGGNPFQLECPSGTSVAFSSSSNGSATAFRLTPTSALPAGATCAVTVVAAQISDVDAIDPPDTMASDYRFSFTTDSPPSVTSSAPVSGSRDVALDAGISIGFSEPVSATANAFQLECPSGTPVAFSVTPALPAAASGFTLVPNSPLPVGTTCQVRVLAAEVRDVDSGDPPDTMTSDYRFGFTTVDAAPSVVATSPVSGSLNVSLNPAISVTFSEPVTTTSSTFRLECPSGTPAAFSSSGTGPATTFTITPTSLLPEGTLCEVTVVAAEVHDTDTSDPPDSMASDYRFSFTTDKAPSVAATSPVSGSLNLGTGSRVTIIFDEPVNVTGSAFRLECPSATPVAFSSSGTGPATTFTLVPTSPLPVGTTCQVTVIANQVSDADTADPPDLMASNYSFSFSTDSPPSVVATSPANAATGLGLASTIAVTFSEAVNVSSSAFGLECPSGTSVAFTSSAGPASVFTLTPSGALPAGTTCAVTVVASQVTDADSGDPPDAMTTDYSFSFSTDTAPTVTAVSPANGSTGVSISPTIAITFSEPVAVDAGAFGLECPSGTPVALSTSAGPATTFALTPTAALPQGTTCQLTVLAAKVHDSDSGDPPDSLASDYTTSFSTDSAPSVLAISPANGSTDIALTSTIAITFSEPVSVDAGAFGLECPSGTPVAGLSVSPGPATSFVLTPTSALPVNTLCRLTVSATAVHDSDSGDPPDSMASDVSFSFTTVDDNAPSVLAVSPAAGASDLGITTTIVITFSEPVNLAAGALTLRCNGTPIAFSSSPNLATSFVLTPTASLPVAASCALSVTANLVSDIDTIDPPDLMASDYTTSFSTDATPIVVSSSPVSGTTSSISPTIAITFSEAVNVSASAFQLECPSGTPITFSSSAGPATTFVLTPTTDLPAGVLCQLTVAAAQVTDVDSGDPPDAMASDYSATFSTDAAPTVVSSSPASGATTGITPTIAITFSEQVAVDAGAFGVECPSGTPVALSTSTGPATTFTLTPTSDLPEGTTCRLTVLAAKVHDADSADPPDNLASDYTTSFSTDAAPTVVSSSPASGATTGITPTIAITFSEAVNVTSSAFQLECPNGTSIGINASASPATSFVLTPTANLPQGAACTVTVVANQITDTDSNDPPDRMASDYTTSFTTDTAPTVVTVSPASAAVVGVNSTIAITFSEPVNVSASAFALECPSGTPVVFSSSGSGPASVFTLTPNTALPAGTNCQLTVVAAQVTDADANDPPDTMASNYTTSFSTDAAPSVVAVSPASAALTNITPTIVITFSEAVNVTSSAFGLECPSGTPIALSSSAGPATTFALTPTSDLPAGVNCRLTVVAAQVTDADAIDPPDAMASDYTTSFSTDAAPSVTGVAPSNGAPNIKATSNITVSFSEPVNAGSSAFALECPVGSPITLVNTTSSPASQFVLDPQSNLPFGATCVLTVTAAAITDADLVDPPDAMTSTITSSFSVEVPPPVAANDTYSATGNIGIAVPAASGVLGNDTLQSGAAAAAISAFAATSTNGGQVSLAADGSFSYNPAAGFNGNDTFTYTLSNSGGSSTATVTVAVSKRVWFVNPAASAGDGRLSSPFNTLASIAANSNADLDQPGDLIFVYAGSLAAGIALEPNQILLGQAVDLASALPVYGIVLAPFSNALPSSGSRPTLNAAAAANAATLAGGNTISGLNLSASGANTSALAGSNITGTNAISLATLSATSGGVGLSIGGQTGSLTIDSDATGINANSSGAAVDITGGGGTITINVPVSQTGAGSGVRVANRNASSSIGFNSAVSALSSNASSAVFLNNNLVSTISFSGGLAIGGSTTPLVATSTGSLAITGANNTIAATNSSAANIGSTALNVSFKSISAGGSFANALVLNGTTGSFQVTGVGTTSGSGGTLGGTLNGISGDAILLTNASNITLTNMIIGDPSAAVGQPGDTTTYVAGKGINISSVNGLAISNTVIARTGSSAMAGSGLSDLALIDSKILNSGVDATSTAFSFKTPGANNLAGTVLISNTVFDAMSYHAMDVIVDKGTLTMTVQGSTFSNNDALLCAGPSPCFGTAIQMRTNTPQPGAQHSLTVQNSSFSRITNVGVAVYPNGDTVGVNSTVNISGNSFVGFSPTSDQRAMVSGIDVSPAGKATLDFLIQNNAITNTSLVPLNVYMSIGSPSNVQATGKIEGNLINANNTANSNGIRLVASPLSAGTVNANVKISNNTVKNISGIGIEARANTASGGTLDLGLINNTVSNVGFSGARITSSRAGNSVCAAISGNAAIGNSGGGYAGLQLSQSTAGVFNLDGYGGSPAAATFVQNNNPSSSPAATAAGTYGGCTSVAKNLLRAAAGSGPGASSIEQATLDAAAARAAALWKASGISHDETARLAALRFNLADLPADRLGDSEGLVISIDRDAAGWGWFSDSKPRGDAQFQAGTAQPGSAAAGRIDLLSVVAHEIGHALGHDDIHATSDDLMAETLPLGTRRLPATQATAQQAAGNLVSVALGSLPAGKRVTISFDVVIGTKLGPSVRSISNQATILSAGNPPLLSDDPATPAPSDPTITVLQRGGRLFLPLVLNVSPGYPDLVVDSISATPAGLAIVIRNQGREAVVNPFWVDFYLNPRQAPSGVNQTWQKLGAQGAAWGVSEAALPLAPGASLTLRPGDRFYRSDLSLLPASIPAGTPLYAQVDSANTLTNYGAVLESHEVSGTAYNNILGPVKAGSTVAVRVASAATQAQGAQVPLRP